MTSSGTIPKTNDETYHLVSHKTAIRGIYHEIHDLKFIEVVLVRSVCDICGGFCAGV